MTTNLITPPEVVATRGLVRARLPSPLAQLKPSASMISIAKDKPHAHQVLDDLLVGEELSEHVGKRF